MNRYKFLLQQTQTGQQIVGLFPWGTIIDTANTNHKDSKIHFFSESVDFLKSLASKRISLVLFINQFKPHPLAMPDLQEFVNAVEDFTKQQGVTVLGAYWCPGVDKNDPFVVPNPGMFVRVTENLGVTWDNIPVLSANDNDLSAAAKVKATPIKIGSSHKKYQSYNDLASWLSTM